MRRDSRSSECDSRDLNKAGIKGQERDYMERVMYSRDNFLLSMAAAETDSVRSTISGSDGMRQSRYTRGRVYTLDTNELVSMGGDFPFGGGDECLKTILFLLSERDVGCAYF